MAANSMTELVRKLRKLGLEVSHTNGGHYRVETARGPVFLAKTGGGGRGDRNAIAELRRRGVDL